ARGDSRHELTGGPEILRLLAADDLDTEPVVATQHVAKTGDQRARHDRLCGNASARTATRISPSATVTGNTRSPSPSRSRRRPLRMSYRQPCHEQRNSVPASVPKCSGSGVAPQPAHQANTAP